MLLDFFCFLRGDIIFKLFKFVVKILNLRYANASSLAALRKPPDCYSEPTGRKKSVATLLQCLSCT